MFRRRRQRGLSSTRLAEVGMLMLADAHEGALALGHEARVLVEQRLAHGFVMVGKLGSMGRRSARRAHRDAAPHCPHFLRDRVGQRVTTIAKLLPILPSRHQLGARQVAADLGRLTLDAAQR